LGRSYFPNVNIENFDEATKIRLVEDIEKDISTSNASLPLLPISARRAVTAAELLFAELNQKIRNTSAEKLIETRISVGTPKKILILLRSFIGV
jgi:phytoene/squalene synthetase